MNRIYLKRKKKIKKSRVLIISFIFIIILILIIINILNKKALPLFNKYSKLETKRIISAVVDSSVTNYVKDNINIDKILLTTKDNNGNIKSIDFNTVEVNKILTGTSKVVEENLKKLEKGKIDKFNINTNISNKKLNKGVVFELPSGIMFNNEILTNIMPKIPIKLELIGNIICYINTDIKNYGINNALITINIDVVAEEKIILPFSNTITKVETNIPIVMKLIEGEIPSYYMDGYLSNPSITRKVE